MSSEDPTIESRPVSWKYSIPGILKKRDEILSSVVPAHAGQTREGDDFDVLVEDFLDCLPKSVPRDVVWESISHLAGEVLTKSLLKDTAWRLAGNQWRLSRRKVVTPWVSQPFDEWVPVQIMAARRGRGFRQKPGYRFVFQILGGSPCPLKVTRFWSDRFCRFLAPSLGFARSRPSPKSGRVPRGQFASPTELVTMRLLVLIEKDRSTRTPEFHRTGIASGLVQWNKEQLKYRDRLDQGYGCPFGQPASLRCFQCPVGYSRCRAGAHRSDFYYTYCEGCGGEDAPYDPDLSDEMCVNCFNRNALRKENQ